MRTPVNRSAWVPAAAALVLIGLACGTDAPSEPTSAENNLVFTRADGSRIEFSGSSQVYAWCGHWADDVEDLSVHVLFFGPGDGDPGWKLSAVLRDVTVGEALDFPNMFIWNQPRNVNLFLVDPPNELSTQVEESSGSVTIEALYCGRNGGLRFSIDAVIGSEFGGDPSVSVSGTFSAPIGQPPPFKGAAPPGRRP